MHTYKDLKIWQKGMELVFEIYKLTTHFPKEEIYGLTSQMRRSTISIPSNIAEGKFRQSQTEFRRFLTIAFGSGAELETQIEISKNLFRINKDLYKNTENLLVEIMKMLNKLISNLS